MFYTCRCHNGGECRDMRNNFECLCTSQRYAGRFCEVDLAVFGVDVGFYSQLDASIGKLCFFSHILKLMLGCAYLLQRVSRWLLLGLLLGLQVSTPDSGDDFADIHCTFYLLKVLNGKTISKAKLHLFCRYICQQYIRSECLLHLQWYM